MTIKLLVDSTIEYTLIIEWNSMYKYRTVLHTFDDGSSYTFFGRTVIGCIREADHYLRDNGHTISKVVSVIEYLHPQEEIMNVLHGLETADKMN